jgi:hypothetical protein
VYNNAQQYWCSQHSLECPELLFTMLLISMDLKGRCASNHEAHTTDPSSTLIKPPQSLLHTHHALDFHASARIAPEITKPIEQTHFESEVQPICLAPQQLLTMLLISMHLLGSSRLPLTLKEERASLPQVPVMRRISDQNFSRPPEQQQQQQQQRSCESRAWPTAGLRMRAACEQTAQGMRRLCFVHYAVTRSFAGQITCGVQAASSTALPDTTPHRSHQLRSPPPCKAVAKCPSTVAALGPLPGGALTTE